jgi:hypothetical protein
MKLGSMTGTTSSKLSSTPTARNNRFSTVALKDKGGPVDDMQQMLLARIAGDSEQGAMPSLPDLLEQALGDNPVAAPLAAALRRRQEAAAVQVDEWDEDDVLRRLYAEVESLRARAAVLADALGACKLCWGEDITCPACRGRGYPGGRSPRGDLFESFIAPAIRRRERDMGLASMPAPDPL